MVRLIVLAPSIYFRAIPQGMLRCMCDAVNVGLAAECTREGPAGLIVEMDIQQFADSFQWPCTDDDLITAVLGRRRVL